MREGLFCDSKRSRPNGCIALGWGGAGEVGWGGGGGELRNSSWNQRRISLDVWSPVHPWRRWSLVIREHSEHSVNTLNSVHRETRARCLPHRA